MNRKIFFASSFIVTNEILGRQFDKNGNANSWWDSDTIRKFNEKAQCFVDMYGNYSVPELIPPLDAKDAHVWKSVYEIR